MAFFNEIGRKASEVAAKTVLKTQEVAETARLNSQINDLQRRQADLYTILGKEYVAKYMNECEEDFVEVVNEILGIDTQINDIKKTIQDIQGQAVCPNCGEKIARDAQFCSSCGFKIPLNIDTVEYIFCDKCGTKLKKGTKFCTSCGNQINFVEREEINSEIVDEEIVNEEEKTKKVCPNCGNEETEEDVMFCTVCGTRL